MKHPFGQSGELHCLEARRRGRLRFARPGLTETAQAVEHGLECLLHVVAAGFGNQAQDACDGLAFAIDGIGDLVGGCSFADLLAAAVLAQTCEPVRLLFAGIGDEVEERGVDDGNIAQGARIDDIDPEWHEPGSLNRKNHALRERLIEYLMSKVGDDPELAEKCIPNYPPMGKRILNDSSWFEMLLRDNVDLVTTPIERIVEDGVVDSEGKHYPADVLVLATGFGMTKLMQQFNIIGEGGVTLRDVWGEEEPRSYVGTMVPKFPNLFLINGPNSGATHGAGVNIYSEAQVHYILTCLDRIFERGGKTIQPTQDLVTLPGPLSFVEGTLTEGWTVKTADGHSTHLFTDAEIFGWTRPEPRRHAAAQRLPACERPTHIPRAARCRPPNPW